MKFVVTSGVIVTLLFATSALNAQEQRGEKLYLNCKVTRTWDEKTNEISPTSGVQGLIVTIATDGNLRIASDKIAAPYIGTATEVSLYAAAEYKLDSTGTTVRDWIEISRLTGEYKNGFSINAMAGLVHFGECSPSTRKF
jgi:hypothetical protein